MPLIHGGILGQRHGTQHHHAEKLLVGTVLKALRQPGIICGLRMVITVQMVSQRLNKGPEGGQLGDRRRGMHPVQRVSLSLAHQFCRADIGGDHAFLDKHVSIVAH